MGTPALPTAPPSARTSCQARHRRSGRKRRSDRAGNRQFRLLVAAQERRRWRGRELSWGVVGPCRAGTVTDLLARPSCRRGPALPARGVVAMIAATMASANGSPNLLRDFTCRRLPAVTAAVGRHADETSLVPSPPLTASRSPDAGGRFSPACQNLDAFRGRRRAGEARRPREPWRAHISTLPEAR
jgi:hypothetical protein